jgi:hypothetical protein
MSTTPGTLGQPILRRTVFFGMSAELLSSLIVYQNKQLYTVKYNSNCIF